MIWYMEQLYQVWEKLSLDGMVHGAAVSGLGETESGWFGHGEAKLGFGGTESGWFRKWRSLNRLWRN